MKKSYIIVDELNRWQATGYDKTEKEVQETVKEVRERLEEEGEEETFELLLFEIKGRPINV